MELSSTDGQQDLYDYVNRPRRHILEVLHDFRHSTPHVPVEYLFDLFPRIRPRSFSIASSFDRTPDKVELLVAVVRYRSKLLGAPRLGLCSNFLKRLVQGSKVDVRVEKGGLRFPGEGVPVVMVGPGTGIAPFRAYALGRKSGAKCVFFGSRSESKDFYFREDWEAMPEVTLLTAFSRDQEEKVYVQHLIKKNGELVVDLIVKRGGWFLVAGNAKRMPDEVRETLRAVVSKHFGSEDEGERYVARMEVEGRYQTETWS